MVHVLIRFERFTISSHRFYRWSLTIIIAGYFLQYMNCNSERIPRPALVPLKRDRESSINSVILIILNLFRHEIPLNPHFLKVDSSAEGGFSPFSKGGKGDFFSFQISDYLFCLYSDSDIKYHSACSKKQNLVQSSKIGYFFDLLFLGYHIFHLSASKLA